jgi:hypothetical protein
VHRLLVIVVACALAYADTALAQVPTTTSTTLAPGLCRSFPSDEAGRYCDDGDRWTDDFCQPFYCHDPNCDPTVGQCEHRLTIQAGATGTACRSKYIHGVVATCLVMTKRTRNRIGRLADAVKDALDRVEGATAAAARRDEKRADRLLVRIRVTADRAVARAKMDANCGDQIGDVVDLLRAEIAAL